MSTAAIFTWRLDMEFTLVQERFTTRHPEYSVLKFKYGWVLCSTGSNTGIPIEALMVLRQLFGKEDVMEPGICHHLHQTSEPNAVMCITSPKNSVKWRADISEWLSTRPAQAAWWEGFDVGLSSAAIFAVFCEPSLAYIVSEYSKESTPKDADDLGRCERLLKLFPEWKPQLHKVAERIRPRHGHGSLPSGINWNRRPIRRSAQYYMSARLNRHPRKWRFDMDSNFENFELAFRDGTGSVRVDCECGLIFYNHTDSGCLEEDELAELEKNPKARPVDYTCRHVSIEGRTYADGCECWHPRAKKIIGFLDGHAHKIADYITREKARKQAEADSSPVVKDTP
jgi:hypothetical protein